MKDSNMLNSGTILRPLPDGTAETVKISLDPKTKHLKPHMVVAMIKFDLPKDQFLTIAKDFIVRAVQDKTVFPIDYDQVVVLGEVAKETVNELRFIKFVQM